MIPKRRMGNPISQGGAYTLVFLREASSFFIAVWLVLFLALLHTLSYKPEHFDWYVKNVLGHPVVLGFTALALAFSLYHTITWFHLTPRAAPPWAPGVWNGDQKTPDAALIAPNYVAFLAVSALIVAVALGKVAT